MCGIAGRFNFQTQAPVDAEVLRAMADCLAHRGPDAFGVHVDGPVGFAHRRLAVIDLSEQGRQPMTAGADLRITFNGEIYNFQTLRSELESCGHAFHTQTDTEVILAAYREWGTECVSRLRGMFAFAIWDARTRSLFMARDRVGKKPLYYRVDRDGIVFASEPKAFLLESGFQVQPDPEALRCFLALQYVPAPLSAFGGVRRLPPGHYLFASNAGVTVQRYWRLRYLPKRDVTEAEAAEELMARLSEATKIRLISDVPLGAFLSGGMDSGLIVALMARLGSAPVKTFSIGFEERAYDELQYARQVVERYRTNHQEFIVRPDAVAILPKLVWHYNEPFADSSAIPTWYLAELTRRSVTVALTGDAGDENFGGYDRYLATRLAGWYDALGVVGRPVGAAVRSLPDAPQSRAWTRAKRFFDAQPQSAAQRYASLMMPFGPKLAAELFSPAFATAGGPLQPSDTITRWYAESDAADFIDATMDVDVNTYLPDDLLVKVDIATMAHGLEARCPFLDHEVMEFAASLPTSMKVHGLTRKYLLRQIARPLLPDAIIDRPKRGFGVPLDVWFQGELKTFVGDLVLGETSRKRGYFNHATVERLFNEHVSGARKWHHQLWSLVIFELWHRMFVDRRPTSAPT